MKNNRFLLLLAFALFVFIPFSVNAETEYSRIYVTIDNPQENALPDKTATLKICNTDELCHDVENAELEWYVYGNDENPLSSTDTFQTDIKYYFLFTKEWDEKLYNEYKLSDNVLFYVNSDEYRLDQDYFYISGIESLNIIVDELIEGQAFPTTAKVIFNLASATKEITTEINHWSEVSISGVLITDIDPNSVVEKGKAYVPKLPLNDEFMEYLEKVDFRTQKYTNGENQLYYIAKDVKNYKIVFDANGGTFKDNKTQIEITDILNFDYDTFEKPTKEGYVFAGFYTTDNKTYMEINTSEAGFESDTTFYAKWAKKTDKYTIDFENYKKPKLEEIDDFETALLEFLIGKGQFEFKDLDDNGFELYTKSGKLVMKYNGETVTYGDKLTSEDNISYTLTNEDKEKFIKGGYDVYEKIELIFAEVKSQDNKLPENPKTFDGIGKSIFMGTISLIGLVVATIYLKKKNKLRA